MFRVACKFRYSTQVNAVTAFGFLEASEHREDREDVCSGQHGPHRYQEALSPAPGECLPSSHLDFPQASRRERLGPAGQRGGARCTSRARFQLQSSFAPCSDEVSQLQILSVQSDEAGSPLRGICSEREFLLAKMLRGRSPAAQVTSGSGDQLLIR